MNVKLRTLKRSDASIIYELLQDKDVTQYTASIPYPYSMKHAEDFILYALKPSIEKSIHYAIMYDDQLVGVIGIERGQGVKYHTAEIGYWLGKSYWDLGIMSEALSLMIELIEKDSDIHKLYAPVFIENKASQKALKNNGFKEEAHLKDEYLKDGALHDAVYMSRIINHK